MAHPAQLDFFAMAHLFFPNHFEGRVIDIGSLDINGGPHRNISPREYVGVDLAEGPNVNLVSRGEDVDLPSGHFDVAMSSECFEHNPNWRDTFRNMYRLTRPGGLVVFSCATWGRPEHGTTRSDGGYSAPFVVEQGSEHYENVSELSVLGISARLGFSEAWTLVEPAHCDLFFAGLRKGSDTSSRKLMRDFRKKAVMTFRDGYFPTSEKEETKTFKELLRRHKFLGPMRFLARGMSRCV